MPYVLSPLINSDLAGMWFEGNPYEKEKIYSIEEGKQPPVNYDLHKIKAHSLTHCEAPLHTQSGGFGIEAYFKNSTKLFGKVSVVRLEGDSYNLVDKEKAIFHWEVTKAQLQSSFSVIPNKLILTTDTYPVASGTPFHDPNYVLTLSQEAADWLLSNPNFNMYGTSWKSSDFKPGSRERPIHNTLFRQASIFECLDLKNVPSGEYFFVGFPLPIVGASESPVCPVLFARDEILSIF